MLMSFRKNSTLVMVTPVVEAASEYADGKFVLRVKQSMNPPFHIPFTVKIGEREEVRPRYHDAFGKLSLSTIVRAVPGSATRWTSSRSWIRTCPW